MLSCTRDKSVLKHSVACFHALRIMPENKKISLSRIWVVVTNKLPCHPKLGFNTSMFWMIYLVGHHRGYVWKMIDHGFGGPRVRGHIWTSAASCKGRCGSFLNLSDNLLPNLWREVDPQKRRKSTEAHFCRHEVAVSIVFALDGTPTVVHIKSLSSFSQRVGEACNK